MPTARATLTRHPLAPWPGPELSIAVTVAVRADGGGECRFEVGGDLSDVLVPERATPERADGLWRHTCFELFAARRGTPGYLEFNFAPSGRWAAYAFSAYRAPLPPPPTPAPAIRAEATARRLVVTAHVAPASWPGDATLDVGLAAVLETRRGALGYYALTHPAERPDFHDRRGFALTLGCASETA